MSAADLELEDESVLSDAQQKQVIANAVPLIELFTDYLGMNVRGQPQPTQWQRFAWGILSRSRYTLHTILRNQDRPYDTAGLTRMLWEHAVTFAWVAIDPDEHLRRFAAWCFDERKKMFNDLNSVGAFMPGRDAISAELQATAVAFRDVVRAPALPDRALQADQYWSARLPNAPEFRRSYANLFRFYSAFLHPTTSGVEPFLPPLGADTGEVGEPRFQFIANPAVNAVGVFTHELLVSSIALGWPTIGEVLVRYSAGFAMARHEENDA